MDEKTPKIDVRRMIEQGLFTEAEFEVLDRFFNGPKSVEPGVAVDDGEINGGRV